MKRLRIKDNTPVKKEPFSDIGRLTAKIADKTLEQLEREGVFVFPEIVEDTEDLAKDQMILQSVNDTFCPGNVMGFLGCGDERLIIASRFGGEREDYFFQYLLNKVLDFPNILDLEIEFIKGKPRGNNLLLKVKDEVNLVISATPGYEIHDRQRIIDENKKSPVRHAYFREYLALQRLCLLILRHQKHQNGYGSKQIYGILFDGAWLWEEYIFSLIKETFYHPMNKSGRDAQRLFNGNVGLIYPDFISRNAKARVVADAKYKPVGNIDNRRRRGL